jgi:hypothetical protein
MRSGYTPVDAVLARAAATYAQSTAEVSSVLDEIVVTAQKCSENAQSVPMSITPLPASRLIDTGVTTKFESFPGAQFTIPRPNNEGAHRLG